LFSKLKWYSLIWHYYTHWWYFPFITYTLGVAKCSISSPHFLDKQIRIRVRSVIRNRLNWPVYMYLFKLVAVVCSVLLETIIIVMIIIGNWYMLWWNQVLYDFLWAFLFVHKSVEKWYRIWFSNNDYALGLEWAHSILQLQIRLFLFTASVLRPWARFLPIGSCFHLKAFNPYGSLLKLVYVIPGKYCFRPSVSLLI